MNSKLKQSSLYYLGYYKYKIDGVFGSLSKKATKEFQKTYDLDADGIFGTKTTIRMYEIWKYIQIKLNSINNSSLIIDGIVGIKTKKEIEIFQKNNKIIVTGICDKQTLKKINDLVTKPNYPVNNIKITQLYKEKTHNGIDIGWDKNIEKSTPLIYAPLDMKVVYNTTSTTAGNYLVGISKYDDKNDILFRFLHLKEKSKFNVGQIINKAEQFGVMGTTGRSTGIHLHFEVWIVPKNYKYSFSDRYKYLKNPIDFIYMHSNQEARGKQYNLLSC